MSSLWGHLDSRLTDGSDRSIARYTADKNGFDVGSILAATRNELPFMDRSKLAYDAILGSGTTFTVHRELFYHTGWEAGVSPPWYVAVKYVKLINKSEQDRRQLLRNVTREIRVMMHPALRNHLCIVPLLAYGWDNDPANGAIPYLVSDYSSHGELGTYLRRFDIPPGERQDLAMDVAIGLAALHAEGIVHGDMKQANILVYDSVGLTAPTTDAHEIRQGERPQTAKLADFGAVIFNADEHWTYLGTSVYLAPELQGWHHNEQKPVTWDSCCKADIYSFGILLWEVMNKGKSFMEELFPDQASNLEGLQRLYQTETNGLLQQALLWSERQNSAPAILHVVEETFELCLQDGPQSRPVMSTVVVTLGKGTATRRAAPIYPPRVETPPDPVTVKHISQPNGYCVRSSAPYIAIPIPSRVRSPYVKRYDPAAKVWLDTTEVDGELHDRKYAPSTVDAPEVGSRHWVNPQALDLFEMSAMLSPPWDVQCSVVDRLKADASGETDQAKKANAHLQLAVSYYIGFGCEPDSLLVLSHLEEASLLSAVAYSMKHGVLAAFSTQGVRNAEAAILRELEPGHDIELAPYVERLQRILVDKKQALDSIPDRMSTLLDASLDRRLAQAFQSGIFETALKSAEHWSTSRHTKWSGIWPTPMHWLILFSSDQAVVLLKLLVSPFDSPEMAMKQFGLLPADTFYLPELAIELFGSPLHWAARIGNASLAALLLKYGSDINARWRKELRRDDGIQIRESLSYSALDLAVMWHHADMVTLLLRHGAQSYGGDVHEQHSAVCLLGSPVRPLSRYVQHGAIYRQALISTVEALINAGQDLNAISSAGHTMLNIAFSHCDQDHYVLEVLSKASSPETRHRLSRDVLITAVNDAKIRRCSISRLQVAMTLTRDVNAVDTTGKSALHYACEGASTAMVKFLLADSRIDVNCSGSLAPAPLSLAARSGSRSVAALLMEAGAILDSLDDDAHTPLQHALASVHADMAAMLINTGASVLFPVSKAKHDHVQQQAVSGSHLETSALVMATGNKQRSGSILTALLRACVRLREQAMLDFRDSTDWTALHHATWFGDFDGVNALLEAGADFRITSRNGLPRKRRTGTPLEMATRLLAELSELGTNGWQKSSLAWLAKGGPVTWKSYLSSLGMIIGRLTRAEGG